MAEPAPPRMLWNKALLPLSIAGIGDAFGSLFALFGIFGPVIAGVGASLATSERIGETAGNILGTVVAGGTALFAGGALQIFGMIMAMVVGFLSWMIVGFILLARNARIYTPRNRLRFFSVLLGDQLPFINVLPLLTPAVFFMYRTQIKDDKKAYAAYLKRQKVQQALLMRVLQIEQVSRAQEVENGAIHEQERTTA
jgi:hypothetical protein